VYSSRPRAVCRPWVSSGKVCMAVSRARQRFLCPHRTQAKTGYSPFQANAAPVSFQSGQQTVHKQCSGYGTHRRSSGLINGPQQHVTSRPSTSQSVTVRGCQEPAGGSPYHPAGSGTLP
jgi:hypothetical protein